jgi:hypothetical protein
MKTERLLAMRQQYQTSHILHLLLSIISFGLWIPVWLLVALSNGIERGKIDRKLDRLED